jgi:hypothetical protein
MEFKASENQNIIKSAALSMRKNALEKGKIFGGLKKRF